MKNSAIIRTVRQRALAAGLAALVAFEVLVIAPRPAVLLQIAAILWIVYSGVRLARAVFSRDSSGIAAWLIGPALGFGFGVFGLLLIWAAGMKNWIAIVGGPAMTWGVAAAARRWGGLSLRLPVFDRRDTAAVLGLLLLVPLITAAPYAHVREPVADGEAYRAYFTADFVWGMTVETELAKGEVPPASPFLRGSQLHYYWMSHLLSGALYRNLRWGLTAEQVLLVTGLAFGMAALPFLYALTRIAGGSALWAAIAIAAAFVANSYEGFNRLWLLHQHNAPYSVVKTLNIDAVTRWFYQGMPVDGLQRMLLYQPHHLTGYMLALAALWVVGFAEDVAEMSIALSAGVLLGLGFLFSTFTAIIIGVALGVLYAVRLVAARRWTSIVMCTILGGGPVAIAVATSLLLAYTDRHAGFLIRFGLNPVATHQWPFMLLLSFGPLIVVAIAGLLRVGWVVRQGAAATALAASALAFYFLTDVPDQQGVWVGWRSGHLLLIALAVIAAASLTAVWSNRRWRLPLIVVLTLLAVPAMPTTAIDVYNAQDVSNRTEGPGFPWTLIVSPGERQALDWIRHTTPEAAIVQYEPIARGATWWCYITAFAERRMAAGLPGAMIPFKPFQMASEDVRDGIFLAKTADDAYRIAAFMGIDYLLVGGVERRRYHDALVEIAKRPDLFPQVFKNDDVTIYAVKR